MRCHRDRFELAAHVMMRLVMPALLVEMALVLEFVGHVRARAGGDENRARRNDHFLAGIQPLAVFVRAQAPGHQRLDLAVGVHARLFRVEALGVVNAFLEGLDDFLVVAGVGRRLVHALAVGDGDAAPLADELQKIGRGAGLAGALTLRAHRAAVGEKFVEDFQRRRIESGAHGGFAFGLGQRLVALQHLFDLHDVVRLDLGGGVHAGEAAADHHRRQAHLQVGEARMLGRAGQLQRHEEIVGLAHAGREAAGNGQGLRQAGADADGDMIETEVPGVLHGQRAAEAHAAEHLEMRTPRQ